MELADALCDALELDVNVPNYQLVGPAARKKLSGLINHYRKFAHPFTQCVRDNTKRFGDRAKKVCAVLTDLEKNTTHWRTGRRKVGTSLALSELVDQELFDLLYAISRTDYQFTVQLAVVQDACEELAELTTKARSKLKKGDFVFPDKAPGSGSYPIPDKEHGGQALARAAGKPEYAAVKGAVCKRYPDLPACKGSS